MIRFRNVVLAALLLVTTVWAKDDPLACKERRDLVNSCRIVHGRMMYYNGTPTFRIWIIGTHRLLGVQEIRIGDDPERPLAPVDVLGKVGSMEHEIYADFEVCPLSVEKPRAMQMVCVEAAKHVVIAPYEGARIKHTSTAQTN